MSEIQYGKDYDHWTGNTDARLERLRQGLDLNSKDWPTDLDYLYWRQGFTKKPVRVKNVKELKARKDLYQGADGENLLVYRGVSNDKWSDQFKGKGNQGDLYFAGEGIYGNGSYAASRSIHSTKATLTKGNENALTLAKNYTEPYGSKITDAQKEIRTTVFGIKKGANIKTWKKGVSTKKLNPKEPHAFPDSDWYEKEFKQWQKDIKKEEPKLPSKAEMANNVTKSLARTVKSFVSGDGISTTDKERKKRMKECLSCAWYIKEKKRCAKCGCVVALKTYLLEDSCPVGKW